jgi:hypothetical protein
VHTPLAPRRGEGADGLDSWPLGVPQVPTMRINIWIVLGALLVLWAITRYTHYKKDPERICANDPTASICER